MTRAVLLGRPLARVAEYNAKGFTFPVDVFTPREAAANREYFNWIFAEAEARGITNCEPPAPAPLADSYAMVHNPNLARR
jgi:hypothetical protein